MSNVSKKQQYGVAAPDPCPYLLIFVMVIFREPELERGQVGVRRWSWASTACKGPGEGAELDLNAENLPGHLAESCLR